MSHNNILNQHIIICMDAIYVYRVCTMHTGNASSYTLSVFDFPPGDYNVTITATDINGQTVTEVVSLFLSGK